MVLYPEQEKALEQLHNGSILVGGVGSGKSVVAASYWLRAHPDKQLVVITTAAKRDSMEWGKDIALAGGYYPERFTIASWNTIDRFVKHKGCFFIFDEQHVSGGGKWGSTFLKITKHNHWILLSATPGDVWMDFANVFIANGFFKNKTQFYNEHVVWDPFTTYPRVKKYVNEGRLERMRRSLYVDIELERKTVRYHSDIRVQYDKERYDTAVKTRFNPYRNEPITHAGSLCYVLRRIVNESAHRIAAAIPIVEQYERLIIFYNFDYELEQLRTLAYLTGREHYERNGHRHDPLPEGREWIYLVQYNASEGWNCVTTNAVLFYSLSYSWRSMEQAEGRIDRLNTAYVYLRYYTIISDSPIDKAIRLALSRKKVFNERAFEKEITSCDPATASATSSSTSS